VECCGEVKSVGDLDSKKKWTLLSDVPHLSEGEGGSSRKGDTSRHPNRTSVLLGRTLGSGSEWRSKQVKVRV
jgi:hypothetical protein